MLAPDPVESLLGHAERNDDIDKIPIFAGFRRLERRDDAVPFRGIVIDQIGNLDDPPGRRSDQVKTGLQVDALPVAEVVHDVLGLAVLVLQALARVDRGDVDDRLDRRVEQRRDLLGVWSGVEAVSDVEGLEVLVAVELLVVGIGDGLELRLVLRRQHGNGIAAEIAAGHGDDVGLVARDQLRQLRAQAVACIGRDVMKLIDRDEPVVEGFRTQLIEGKAEGCMGADQNPLVAGQEFADCLYLGLGDLGVIGSGRIAQVPLRRDHPVLMEAILAERFATKAGADRAFGHTDDGLAHALIAELVQRHEHQGARLA